AIDEKRKNFKPAIWIKQKDSEDQQVVQKWFIGAHSNIGGGYASTALSDLALDWMIQNAVDCGLDLDEIELNPNFLKAPDESRKRFYKLVPAYFRPIGKTESGFEELHSSVKERYHKDPDYRPKNLVEYMNMK